MMNFCINGYTIATTALIVAMEVGLGLLLYHS